MQFDDRLDTVLKADSSSKTGATAQYRQLLDLVGADDVRLPAAGIVAALNRLHGLRFVVPAAQRFAAVSELGSRLRSPVLLRYLCEDRPDIAAAAVSAARLSDDQWVDLIPDLPVRARGLLRHRRDLGPQAARLLAQLGAQDMALPSPWLVPADAVDPAAPQPVEPDAPTSAIAQIEAARAASNNALSGISAIVERIEAFRRARDQRDEALAGQTAGASHAAGATRLETADFETNAAGEITWAGGRAAPMLLGRRLVDGESWQPTRADAMTRAALKHRVHLRGGMVAIDGSDAIAGNWRCDATPLFDHASGRYLGHAGRLRRPAETPAMVTTPVEVNATPRGQDELRQVLHELRTPINAIQGFAEIIHHQLFGPVARDYRERARSIANDAGRLQSLFSDINDLIIKTDNDSEQSRLAAVTILERFSSNDDGSRSAGQDSRSPC